jgi:uncharacterized protein with FMN-binding domain
MNIKNTINIIGKYMFIFPVLFITICLFLTCAGAMMEFDMPEIEPVDISLVQDGTYYGEYEGGTENDLTAVDVTVKQQKIETIELIEHFCSPVGFRAEMVIDDVIETQSNVVDAISGATLSSMKILKAIETALNKGIP